jgi:hypothetical protein
MPHIIDDIRQLVKAAHRNARSDQQLVITMPYDREADLYDEPPNGLPDGTRSKLYDEGPRAAFSRILGLPVIWDQEALEVKPLASLDDEQRERYHELYSPSVKGL